MLTIDLNITGKHLMGGVWYVVCRKHLANLMVEIPCFGDHTTIVLLSWWCIVVTQFKLFCLSKYCYWNEWLNISLNK